MVKSKTIYKTPQSTLSFEQYLLAYNILERKLHKPSKINNSRVLIHIIFLEVQPSSQKTTFHHKKYCLYSIVNTPNKRLSFLSFLK